MMTSPEKENHPSHPTNPEQSASFLSRILFLWIQDLMKKGYRAPLLESDVFPCHPNLRSRLVTDLAKYYWRVELKKKSPSLPRALLKANAKLILPITLMCLSQSFFFLAPAVLVSKVSSYFDSVSELTSSEVVIYCCAMCLINLLYIGLKSAMHWNLEKLGNVLRNQTSALVYDKVNSALTFRKDKILL